MGLYKSPILKKYQALIEANTKAYKRFFHGDPGAVPASFLPCVVLEHAETRIGPLTNAEDEHGMQIRLTVIADVRKDLHDEQDGIVPGYATLYELVEGRNADYTLMDSSILGILRGNQVVDADNNLRTDLSTLTSADYTLTERAPDAWFIEARVDFIAHFTQLR